MGRPQARQPGQGGAPPPRRCQTRAGAGARPSPRRRRSTCSGGPPPGGGVGRQGGGVGVGVQNSARFFSTLLTKGEGGGHAAASVGEGFQACPAMHPTAAQRSTARAPPRLRSAQAPRLQTAAGSAGHTSVDQKFRAGAKKGASRQGARAQAGRGQAGGKAGGKQARNRAGP